MLTNKLYIATPEIGCGLPILMPKGAIMKQRLIEYLQRGLLKRQYVSVASPAIGNLSLFKRSGHYPFYKESMFPIIDTQESGIHRVFDEPTNDERYVLKPMNCPFHIAAYDSLGTVSYKQLPIKIFEFGQVYRYEDSGAVNGMFRARSFTQDDGHLFCSLNQIGDLVSECNELISIICKEFKLSLSVKFSKRDDSSEKYVGAEDNWGASEDMLRSQCFKNFGDGFEIDEGGAAFYGPKIDFVAKDKLGRDWQLGTIQLDFNLPERFELGFISDDGSKEVPVLIHRALLGSLERFIACISENYIPTWMNPFGLGIIHIGNDEQYLNDVINSINDYVYPTIIKSPDNLSDAIKKLKTSGVDRIVVIGKREETNQKISLDNQTMSLSEFYGLIKDSYSIPKL